MRRHSEAVPVYERLLQAEPYASDPVTLVNAGIAFFHVGRKDVAIRAIERAIQINPNLADAQRILEQINNAQPAAPAPTLQSAPVPIMPIQPAADPSQLPIPAIFQQN
jgi:tetratricopeptide (TPR) repeat protein